MKDNTVVTCEQASERACQGEVMRGDAGCLRECVRLCVYECVAICGFPSHRAYVCGPLS